MINRFRRWTGDYDWDVIVWVILVTTVGVLLALLIYGIVFAAPAAEEEYRIKSNTAMQEYFQTQIDNGADRERLETKLIGCQGGVGKYGRMYKTPIGLLTCPQDHNLYQ